MKPICAPMGSWKSPLDASTVAAGAVHYHEIQSLGEDIFWLESRPQEQGRVTLVRNGQSILPPGFSARSRVHEYGGGSYFVCPAGAFFVNFGDQELYELEHADSAPRRVTHSGKAERYADFCHVHGSRFAIGVCETHVNGEVVNRLIALDLVDGTVTTLHDRHDFYAAPRICGDKLAFVAWDHPNMPWDATLLYLGTLEEAQLKDVTIIAGGNGASIMEPHWGERRLFYLSDEPGQWNVHSFDAAGTCNVHEAPDEYGGPPWVFAASTFAVVNDDLVIARRIRQGEESLVIIKGDGALTEWDTHAGSYDSLHWHESSGRLLCVTGAPDWPNRIDALSPSGEREVIAGSANPPLATRYASTPESLVFASNGAAHAFFYPPTNPDHVAHPHERPPLLVTTHGGPTAMARRTQNLRIQYYTSRGWAVADLNYAGSSGYGTAYRRKLEGQWGIADVEDCEALVRHLAADSRIDAARCAIRGGSAGGYTTLAALTFTDAFQAGASAYGISDLKALAKDTHKFESRYLDSLVGPWPAAESMYLARSPIHHSDRLACPIIFFQGGKDLVVPPNQSQMMVDALDKKGIAHAYVFYPEEGHGFRDAKNIAHAVQAEYQFLCQAFGITPADTMLDLEVKHL
ncbi:MAG: prolyl oligopeptidase family serine peptidase [Gammaproteobacteria bacterium]|nr:prolyl oligopeptidase family serine peptidase [Gammaproteobacteria bacterium]